MNTFAYKSQRDNFWLPTAVALLISVLLHVGAFSELFPTLHLSQQSDPALSDAQDLDKTKELSKDETKKSQEEDHLLLGRDNADEILTLNWIGYDAFEQLIAMPAKTQQAAFQRLADPIKMRDVDPQIDPATDVMVLRKTVPQPQAAPQQDRSNPTATQRPLKAEKPKHQPVDSPVTQELPDAMEQTSPVVKEAPTAKVVLVPLITPTMDLPDRIAHEQPVMADKPSVSRLPLIEQLTELAAASLAQSPPPARVEPSQQPQEKQDTAPPAAEQQRPTTAQPFKADQLADKPRPTHVPREDRESSPYSLDHYEIIGKIGSVMVGKGIEIQTRIPRFSAVTQASIWPKANPIVQITFAADSVVITAEIILSSGYAGIDSPILASVYHWKAKGPLLEKLNRPFKRQFTFKLFDDAID
ncbi:MAG: hypothetical protein JKX85_03520 [Phycisphaeraceae bacterium]|nr:hypothetical protein [Phycisphaeraceae bacterium]